MDKLALAIPGAGSVNNITQDFTLGQILSNLINAAMLICGALLIIWMFWGAIQYLFAGGDKEELAKARSRITYAIIGFLIVVVAFSFKQYVLDVLKPQDVQLKQP